VNSISPITEDVIKRMLIIDPVKRIEWEELFKHPITTYLEGKVKADM
jgi:serine/threonine protein kinase